MGVLCRFGCGCIGFPEPIIVEGRKLFRVIHVCDGDWNDYSYHLTLRTIDERNIDSKQMLSENEENEIFGELSSLIVAGNKYRTIKTLLS